MSKFRAAGVVSESITDGEGIRYVLFVQGCPHRCPGCHNPETHDFSGGYDADTDEIFKEFSKNPLLSGITFSGGEPFCQPEPLAELAEKVKAAGKNVTVYTGYTIEQLLNDGKKNSGIMKLLDLADVLIDGRFIIEEKSLTLRFRGSKNQRMIDVQKTLKSGGKTIYTFE